MKRIAIKVLLMLLPFIVRGQSTAVFNVKDFGCSGKKDVTVTQFIQGALDACLAIGGGTVYFPPGDYTSGLLILHENTNIHLEAGATLFASKDPVQFSLPARLSLNDPVLIYGENLKNISLSGKGTIDGQAQHTWEDLKEVDLFIKEETENARASGIEMKRAYAVDPKVKLIYLFNCQNIKVEELSLINSPNWTLHLGGCGNVSINNISISNSLTEGVNADGIDIDGCKDVVITNCNISTGDDAICLKTTNISKKPVENIFINNCILTSSSSAFKIGTESFYNFSKIIFSNNIITNTNRAIGVLVRDGAEVSDVLFSNVIVDCNRKHFNWWGDGELIKMIVLKRTNTSKVGAIKEVTLKNIVAATEGSSKIEGFEGSNLKNIQLENIDLIIRPESLKDKRAGDALQIGQVEGLRINNLSIKWEQKEVESNRHSAFVLNQLTDFAIDAVEVSTIKGSLDSPSILIKNSIHGVVKNCSRIDARGTLIKVEGNKTDRIICFDNMNSKIEGKIYVHKEVKAGAVIIK